MRSRTKIAITIVVWVACLAMLEWRAYIIDAPLWLHLIGWYLGIAIWFSLYVSMRTGRTVETMKEVDSMVRVIVGLFWPLYVIVVLGARY